MMDLIVDALGTIGDLLIDLWVNRVVAKFRKNHQTEKLTMTLKETSCKEGSR